VALRRYLDRLPVDTFQTVNDSSEVSGGCAKIMVRDHYMGRRKRRPQFTRSHTRRGFNFHITPLASGAGRLRQNFDLLFPATWKKPSSFLSPARGDEHGSQPLPV
jgi:hypothetical protein